MHNQLRQLPACLKHQGPAAIVLKQHWCFSHFCCASGALCLSLWPQLTLFSTGTAAHCALPSPSTKFEANI